MNLAQSVSSLLSEFMTQLSGRHYQEMTLKHILPLCSLLWKLPWFCGLCLHHTCQKEKKNTSIKEEREEARDTQNKISMPSLLIKFLFHSRFVTRVWHSHSLKGIVKFFSVRTNFLSSKSQLVIIMSFQLCYEPFMFR